MPFKDFTTEILTSADVDLYLMSQVIIRCTSSTRPSSPAQGWHIYETDTQKFMVYNGSSWIPEGSQIKSAIKTSNESVSSSTTLQDDNELFVTVDANTNYYVECLLKYTGETAADFRVGFTLPAGATLTWFHGGLDDTVTSWWGILNRTAFSAASVATIGAGGSGSQGFAHIRGLLKVSATPGTVQFRWAQWASNATAVTVFADSFMVATRL